MCAAQRVTEVPSPCYPQCMKTRTLKTPRPTVAQAKERYEFLDNVVRGFTGPLDELESALGMYLIGHHFGWKVLHMIHSKKTVKKYEDILGIKITETFEAIGPDADRTNALKVIETVSNFWKAVSGDEKVPLTRDTRRAVR